MRIKVGDKVKIIENYQSSDKRHNKVIGKIGEIVNIRNHGGSYPIDLKISGKNDTVWCEDELELVNSKRDFERGDRVRIIDCCNFKYNGDIGELTKIDMTSDDLPYQVDGYKWCKTVELIEDNSNKQKEVKNVDFEIGTMVKIVDWSSNGTDGYNIGDIRKVVGKGNKLEGVSSDICFNDDRLEVVNNLEVEKMEHEMKLENMKPANVSAAKEQCEEESRNAEISEAKRVYNLAVDNRDDYDRQIKDLTVKRKEQQDILEKFKSKKE